MTGRRSTEDDARAVRQGVARLLGAPSNEWTIPADKLKQMFKEVYAAGYERGNAQGPLGLPPNFQTDPDCQNLVKALDISINQKG